MQAPDEASEDKKCEPDEVVILTSLQLSVEVRV
jgi:hypothetical protein